LNKIRGNELESSFSSDYEIGLFESPFWFKHFLAAFRKTISVHAGAVFTIIIEPRAGVRVVVIAFINTIKTESILTK
jgi:hypothetical protein